MYGSRHFEQDNFPPLIPILIGSTSAHIERHLGALLAPYLSDPANIFVLSSDFCHWGSRFRYTYYAPSAGQPLMLKNNAGVSDRPIHESIAAVDKESMNAIETGSHQKFLQQLEETKNTVCGRHPIGVFMAAVEANEEVGRRTEGKEWKGRFRFVRYERSSLVEDVHDSSVSYCSAFAVF